MGQQQQQKWGLQESTNLLTVITNVMSMTVLSFARHSFGKDTLGWPAFGAFIIIMVVASFSASQAMWVYFGVWIISLCWQKSYTNKLMRQGTVIHSRSPGFPALGAKFTKGNVMQAAMFVEPFLCGLLGYMFYDLGERAIGVFLICATASLIFQNTTQRMLDERRVQEMINARIEQEWLSRQLRDR
jgi:hypothetical protein